MMRQSRARSIAMLAAAIAAASPTGRAAAAPTTRQRPAAVTIDTVARPERHGREGRREPRGRVQPHPSRIQRRLRRSAARRRRACSRRSPPRSPPATTPTSPTSSAPTSPNLARSPKVARPDRRGRTTGDLDWDDFYPPARDAVTVNGRVARASRRSSTTLAVVYNKKLFAEAGDPEPKADWTWDDFRDDRQAAHRPGRRDRSAPAGRARGDEDTVWRLWPMVWQAGGDMLTADGKRSASTAQPACRRFDVVASCAQDELGLHRHQARQRADVPAVQQRPIGMVLDRTVAAARLIDAKVDYGVAPLPTFGGEPLTISGPDTWTIFDNGDDALDGGDRVRAVARLSPAQDAAWVTEAGTLPLRRGTAQAARIGATTRRTSPGSSVFIDALDGAA